MYIVCTHIIKMEIKTDKQQTLKRKRKKSNEAKGMQKKMEFVFYLPTTPGLGSQSRIYVLYTIL